MRSLLGRFAYAAAPLRRPMAREYPKRRSAETHDVKRALRAGGDSAQRAAAHDARPHALRMVADRDAGYLLALRVADHRHAVLAAHRDEAVAPVRAWGRPVGL